MGVVTAKNAAGDVAVGIEADGVFVPVVTVPAHRIAHYVERAATLAERAKGHDEAAAAALASEFQVEKTSSRKKATEEGAS